MIDSTNPRQLADNIRKLWDKFKSISGDLLPSRSTATTGQILKLTGENKTPSWADEYSYTPPAYSETEVNTGQKWIDGKDVYSIVINGTFPVIEQSTAVSVNNTPAIDTLIYSNLITNMSSSYRYMVNLIEVFKAGSLSMFSVSPSYSEKPYIIILYYTKPDPTPGRAPEDQEPEEVTPEEKKTTKKKTK